MIGTYQGVVPYTEAMRPMVSLLMPAYNEEHFIEACIRSVQGQTYPKERIEILIADGRSTDQTREILDELARADRRIRVIDNPERLQAPGLNLLAEHAKGDVFVRMDVHCEYAADYVEKCVQVLETSGADNVGGAQRARAKTRFQRALCAALASPLGVGGAKYRSATAEGFVDTVFLGAFPRRVFETIGLWDPKAITNEDAELNQRILETGGRIYLSRDIHVEYYPRTSFSTLAQQYYKYGRGRARTLLKRGQLPSLRPLVPFAFVVAGISLVAIPPLWPVAPFAAAAYALITGAEAVRVTRGDHALIWTTWRIFPVLHASHGWGVARGLVHYLRNPDWAEAKTLAPRERAPHLRAV